MTSVTTKDASRSVIKSTITVVLPLGFGQDNVTLCNLVNKRRVFIPWRTSVTGRYTVRLSRMTVNKTIDGMDALTPSNAYETKATKFSFPTLSDLGMNFTTTMPNPLYPATPNELPFTTYNCPDNAIFITDNSFLFGANATRDYKDLFQTDWNGTLATETVSQVSSQYLVSVNEGVDAQANSSSAVMKGIPIDIEWFTYEYAATTGVVTETVTMTFDFIPLTETVIENT